MVRILFALLSVLFLFSCSDTNKEFVPQFGQTISESVQFKKDTFKINAMDSLNQPILIIEGDDLVIDFNQAVLTGSNDKEWANEFYGLAILIKDSKNITLKNANIHGYKVAILAENVDNLKIENCNFSYNYRQKLKSIREREDLSDWMSYHQNDKDEWLRHGMGIYLKNCDYALVKDVHITGGQNGLMMTECDDGLFYNNEINFNSGVGIGLYRSNRNQVIHNKLDWNVRGYSHGFYNRGQDSAGILVYEQCNENTFAYNSATHSGDGFFLWAGQTTMDTGKGGCNDNLIYNNDFSHAPTNGIEVTFSSNIISHNILKECWHGIWGGYSFNTLIYENEIENCEEGVAIEHGQDISFYKNHFTDVETGIKLWERETQPKDWGYSQNRNVASRNYFIDQNFFTNSKIALEISASDSVIVGGNTFKSCEQVFKSNPANQNLFVAANSIAKKDNPEDLLEEQQFFPKKGTFLNKEAYNPEPISVNLPPQLKDGQNAFLAENHPRGRQYILVNEWGPYDFKYPVIWLREIKENQYTFLLLGPQGNWKVIDGKGLLDFVPKTGTFPATIVMEKDPESDEISLELEFIGAEVTDQFGKKYKRGTVFPFSFFRYEKTLNWEVNWYEYDDSTDPLKDYKAFKKLKNTKSQKSETTSDLAYVWWRSPGNDIHKDKFGTFAKTEVEMEAGQYKIAITSDDGLRFYLDGKLLIDHWDIHVPATDEIKVDLDGKHVFEIEHFEGGGFSTLSFLMSPIFKSQ